MNEQDKKSDLNMQLKKIESSKSSSGGFTDEDFRSDSEGFKSEKT